MSTTAEKVKNDLQAELDREPSRVSPSRGPIDPADTIGPDELPEFEGGQVTRRELHRRFAHLRVSREWYRPAAELIDYLRHLEGTRLDVSPAPQLTLGLEA